MTTSPPTSDSNKEASSPPVKKATGSSDKPRPGTPSKAKAKTRDRFRVSLMTVPVVGVEAVVAVLVVSHAANAVDMNPAVHLMAFIMSAMFLLIYHFSHLLRSGFIRFVSLMGKSFLAMVVVLVLWDLGEPHKVFVGDEFVQTEPAHLLQLGSVAMACCTLAVWSHFLVLRRFKVSDD